MKASKYYYELKENTSQLFLVALFLLFSALLVGQWYFLFTSHRIDSSENDVKIALAPKKNTVNQGDIVFKTPLFGHYLAVEQEIKDSMLDVTVVGIMYSGKEVNSQVLIKSASGEEKLYAVGDILPGGAKIKSIKAASIVVLHNGSLEKLSLPKLEFKNELPTQSSIFDQSGSKDY